MTDLRTLSLDELLAHLEPGISRTELERRYAAGELPPEQIPYAEEVLRLATRWDTRFTVSAADLEIRSAGDSQAI